MCSDTPHVSIGLPVYNGERYLSETIECILKQSYRDFELIISDNGSTDMTREICRGYAEKDRRVRFVRHEGNRGANWNFRHVIALARGMYFRWSSADDLFAPDSLVRCVEILDKHSDVVLCYPKTVLIDGAGAVIRPYDDNLDLRFEDPVERFRTASNRIGLVNVLYGLIRTDVVRSTNLIGNYPGADIVLILELALRGKFYEIDRPLFFRRMHEGASSQIKSIEELQKFVDPTVNRALFSRMWRSLFGKMWAVLGSTLTVAERSRLLYFLLRGMIASRDQYLRELVAGAQAMIRRPRHL